jgi:hypothetical protein
VVRAGRVSARRRRVTVTVALEALRVDHNAIGLSYVLAARLLPAVMFTLVGGVIVERGPQRRPVGPGQHCETHRRRGTLVGVYLPHRRYSSHVSVR